MDNWNISIQWALRRYIYDNVYNPKDYKDEKKRKRMQFRAQFITIIVSALWHGIYPGYFVSFINWILFIQTANEFYRQKKTENSKVNKFHQKYPAVYNGIELAVSTFAITFYGVPFHLMVWSKIWIFIQGNYIIPYIGLYIIYVSVCEMGILGKKKKKIEGININKQGSA